MRWFRRSRKPGATQNGLEGPDQVDADALADLVLDADAAEDDRFVCSTCGRTDLPPAGDWDPPICQECDAAINFDAIMEMDDRD